MQPEAQPIEIKPLTCATALYQPNFNSLPDDGFCKIWQIIGDKKRNIPPVIPVSRTTFLNGVKSGKYPKPVKLGERSTGWPVKLIRALIAEIGG